MDYKMLKFLIPRKYYRYYGSFYNISYWKWFGIRFFNHRECLINHHNGY